MNIMASPQTPSKKFRPSPQAQLMSLSDKMEKQTDEIRKSAAEALGYHAAGLQNRLPETLKTIIQKVDVLTNYVKELKNIKPELTAVYNDLKSTKRMLQYKTESQETLNSENTKLKEHVKELENTFFDEIDEDSEKCLPQTKSSEQLC